MEHAEHVRAPHGRPFVRAWAEEDGLVVGRMAEWAARSASNTPSWYSAQSLGFEASVHPEALLYLELWDKSTLLGSFVGELAELPRQQLIRRELSASHQRASAPYALSFQVIGGQAFLAQCTVFFVRHAESEWNRARRNMNLYRMFRTKDHPLSVHGRDQAEALHTRLQGSASSGVASRATPMLTPDIIYVSPLTRAVQTAVIGLRQALVAADRPGELVLMATAREKQNFCGFDTKSEMVGADVIQRAVNELRLLYKDPGSEVLKVLKRIRVDVQEVQDTWWHTGKVESDEELQARLQEFMSQLLHSPHRTIVVVGHSHFFRAVFQKYLSEEFRARRPEFARRLTTMTMMNCGVVRLRLGPNESASHGTISEVELVLDTVLEDPKTWRRREGYPAAAPTAQME